jgi:hypothetical protein
MEEPGVIQEHATPAPRSDSVPPRPLFDEPLTDKAHYLNGSAVASDGPDFSHKAVLWRSTICRMLSWRRKRRYEPGTAAYATASLLRRLHVTRSQRRAKEWLKSSE